MPFATMAVHQLDALTRHFRPTVTLPRSAALALTRIALAAITALAAVLRFESLGGMSLNPYYDAAVRSLGSSWRGFFLGAFDPNVSVAIDKPPLDLWLQVATTKVFGFTHFALLLPEALGSTVAVLLTYDLVRRGFGRVAGLSAAAALALLPVDVITARSDSMDGVMMALLVLAAWFVVRAIEKGRLLELLAAGAAIGLAFETKLFEALVALPGLAVIYLAGSSTPVRQRLGRLALGGATMVVVGLAWTVGFALAPGAPYPLGSNTGSIWYAIFVYNGTGRLTSHSTRTAADLLAPPSVTRLLSAGPVHLDLLIGITLFAALVFGAAALLLGLVRERGVGRSSLPRGLAAGLAVWLAVGVAVLSYMKHMPVRYLEPLVPAVAAVLGIGVARVIPATAAMIGRRARWFAVAGSVALAAALVATLIYQASTRSLPPAAIAGAVATAIVLVALWVVAFSRAPRRWFPRLAGLAAVSALVSVLSLPLAESAALVRADASDGGSLGALPGSTISALSRYLTKHRGHTRYEFASATAALAAPLIVADDQPVFILAGTPFHTLVTAEGLSRAVNAGQVRYVLISNTPNRTPIHPFPARSPRSAIPSWVVSHGVDVTPQTGLHGYGMLYRVSPGA
jgi:4-amino-4-deoxy-L-arabinose transferase-like glycosyltransferase